MILEFLDGYRCEGTIRETPVRESIERVIVKTGDSFLYAYVEEYAAHAIDEILQSYGG